ncbi:hypothetical protein BZG36_04649 [Bifiguratus adelaidae]|uniref:RRM domain-containing protein n=1 Tax=Bifiguratus adelaidae TaxID=1938954 RepID=A0A261XXU3_9FUNG|nr:hypothetical protein BZG36_04649 [Bifiguratus adelaidae]
MASGSHSMPAMQSTPSSSSHGQSTSDLTHFSNHLGQEGPARNTLWMGDLEPWMDEMFIRHLWSQMQEQVNVKLIKDKFTSMSAGYCFVEFSSQHAAQRALMFDQQIIPGIGKAFRLNWASGGGINDKREDRAPEYSIFVGDLGSDATESMLLSLFQSRYPSCKSAKIMTDPQTGFSRGYAFVRFSSEAEQQRALTEMQSVQLGARTLRVSMATPKTKGNASLIGGMHGMFHPGHHMPHYQGHGMNIPGGLQATTHYQQGPGAFSASSHPSFNMSQHPAQQPNTYQPHPNVSMQMNQAAMADSNNTTVFVGGLTSSYPVHEDDLRRVFSPFGEIISIKIPQGKGCGFVQYAERHSAEVAIQQLNGYQINGARIRLSWGRSNADRLGMHNAMATQAGSMGFGTLQSEFQPGPNMIELGNHTGYGGPMHPNMAPSSSFRPSMLHGVPLPSNMSSHGRPLPLPTVRPDYTPVGQHGNIGTPGSMALLPGQPQFTPEASLPSILDQSSNNNSSKKNSMTLTGMQGYDPSFGPSTPILRQSSYPNAIPQSQTPPALTSNRTPTPSHPNGVAMQASASAPGNPGRVSPHSMSAAAQNFIPQSSEAADCDTSWPRGRGIYAQ